MPSQGCPHQIYTHKKPLYNITKEEKEALHNLSKDDRHMVLIADNGVPSSIYRQDMYIKKCMALLNEQEICYECKYQTKSIHAKIVKQL